MQCEDSVYVQENLKILSSYLVSRFLLLRVSLQIL